MCLSRSILSKLHRHILQAKGSLAVPASVLRGYSCRNEELGRVVMSDERGCSQSHEHGAPERSSGAESLTSFVGHIDVQVGWWTVIPLNGVGRSTGGSDSRLTQCGAALLTPRCRELSPLPAYAAGRTKRDREAFIGLPRPDAPWSAGSLLLGPGRPGAA
jgi:hypothetical protein